MPAAPKYLLPPDNSSDMETGCAFGTCIKFFNLLSNEERDLVGASFDESDLTICRAFPRAVLLDLTVPLVELTLKIMFEKELLFVWIEYYTNKNIKSMSINI